MCLCGGDLCVCVCMGLHISVYVCVPASVCVYVCACVCMCVCLCGSVCGCSMPVDFIGVTYRSMVKICLKGLDTLQWLDH